MKTLANLLLLVVLCTRALAADPSGWRGDGSGIYPNTNPPIHWQQISAAVDALRYQVRPPDGDAPSGQAMPDGVIHDWLILDPLSAQNLGDLKAPPGDALYAEDLATLAPKSGDQVAGSQWRPAHFDTSNIDLAQVFNSYDKKLEQAAYAHVYIYSPADAQFPLLLHHAGTAHLWVNGKHNAKTGDQVLSYTPQMAALKKGWNRILLRITPTLGASGESKSGIWYANFVFRADPGNAALVKQNIRWKTMLPAFAGCGGTVAADGKIFLLSEPADLVCVDQASGKILWVRPNNYDELATEQEKTANPEIFSQILPLQATLKAQNDSFAADNPPKLEPMDGGESFKTKVATEKKLYSLMKDVDEKKYSCPKGQDVGYAGLTPVTDGQHVWAWFATGVTSCYDLSGKLIWRRLDNEGSFFEHGYSVSPILADGKIIVFMNKLIAFDAKSGERLWTTPLTGLAATRFHGTPAVASIGGAPVCILPTGHIVRLSDGKVIHEKGPDISSRQQEIPSPVAIGNTIYELSTFSIFRKVILPDELSEPLIPSSVKTLKLDVTRFPTFYNDWFMASPLIHDGLAYCVNNSGVLCVIDLDTMQVVYQRLLDLDHFQHHNEGAGRGVGVSPALAGGNIYLMGNAGATLVIKPGRTYQELAKNKIESVIPRSWAMRTERFVASPTFVGKQLFIRGEKYLYCIGE